MPDSSATDFALTEELKSLVNTALGDGAPMLLAATSPEGKPVLSYRGSVQTFSDVQLGLWVRNGQGGTIEAIRANPHVALVYRSPSVPVLQFHGRARIAEDEAERAQVFDSAPERERNSDPDRNGTAVIVDLDRVEGVLIGPEGRQLVRLAR